MKRYESIKRSLQDWALETAAGRGSVQDIRQQEAQHLLVNHREYLQLGTCSFSRRGRLSYALRTANPALAQKMEALYIAQFKARGPGGYNVLRGPPSASPAFYAMSRQCAGSAHTPTAVTVQDDDAPATLA
ncbi:hypothetical protein VOLCADRAFT_106543 [Volvox carteri f. nagariensis]|uniref:Uncharacterized protein n=1 Tax=Volvox carteri f. nagariensis TaxID=3068 RepID=D8U7X2_VOLCA|nr:uncharacterized protein VOLCADRAFT_106543 [Volvox carteri f. nagariensis]EFJ44221.1 hypothetical protein VOLCADRAFT_106543 [Volvox carteri f. nagariensis]|eukprot:XP_002954815.1 hypothetical protein VOLCADRAFT_106543 [Volvox carteri f. nagariensis]